MVVGCNSSIAHELVSWSTGWIDSRVDTSIRITAASGHSVLESGALVVHLQVTADTGWIAGVESGSSDLSVELGSDGDRDTLSLTSLPSCGTVGGSVDEESRVARDWSIVEWGEWDGGVDHSGEVGLLNVAVVSIVAAAGSELWIVRFHAGAGVVKFEGTAESVWNTGEEGDVVIGNTGIHRGALSVAELLSSGLEAWDAGGVESDVALEWWSWDGLSSVWIETSIAVTAASSDTSFWGSTVVVNSELIADGRWIASVERSGV